ncbi:ImmA/IrrE family metallo-endopeptidase [Corynebacterium accolens]|uniref:ImmA/IrrE family metallo-endopeptidase n=1 Tax=Corynebacterium accolens TaxID=38284 RepID=UPI00254B792A|nr:ImmA/IrrE family metallo-endopeptidase [Corynebacterium accolens]MDK8469526.1 ImmA/IrrE family metallo-endopeptidase [Corynebacterium accolens]MDK8497908.1 ImmA/IrrE family metallo-endopeptidase [Corynebacterium accolens]MDK8593062.1 ImmA/IrrE family metallo-endopeptidase [Corynebacterium accolens]MDK8675645.1 ImmA/IrrE family metallo-endopeptidase [Corynebacterium accolens]
MVRVEIAPSVLSWAVERTRIPVEHLKKIAGFKLVDKWLEGEEHPTLNQAENLAKRARIPFGYLLLDEPVDDSVKVADFRTVKSGERIDYSPDLEEVLLNSESALAWYSDFVTEMGEETPAVCGKYSLEYDSKEAARAVLEEVDWFPGKKDGTRDRALILRDAIESLGVLVMRSSVVGNSTSRKLDIEEFRGFTLLNKGYALIFINTSDAAVAQLFSLAHELGHVLLGEAGISGERNEHRRVERWCNSFASEFIFPTASALDLFNQFQNLEDYVTTAYRQYGVSRDTAIWTLSDSGAIARLDALHYLSGEPLTNQRQNSNRGGNYYSNITSRLGHRFSDTVTYAFAEGLISRKEASRRLGVPKASALESLVSQLQGITPGALV